LNNHERSLLPSAFSTQPLELLPRSAQVQLSNISAMQLLETGDRVARETWQRAQLGNVLNHAAQKSPWWRERILSAPEGFASLPPLTRRELAQQSEAEGSLVPPESGGKRTYASTGSTGTPVRVYTTAANGYYNVQRSLAQYFINDLPLSENRVQINPALNLDAMQGPVVVRRGANWAGDLSSVFANGSNREIIHSFAPGAMDEVVAAMLEAPVGYLVSTSRFVELLHAHGGDALLGRLGVRAWMHTSDYRSEEMLATFTRLGIRSYSVYSSGETGPLAYECRHVPGHFHVAHSNVIIEADPAVTTQYQGETVSRLLVTGLNAYATPIIRYDIGDLARVHRQCPCGHDGTTLSGIYGRGKSFVRHPDGRLIPFYLSTRSLLKVVAFDECRVRQFSRETLTVEIGRAAPLTAAEFDAVRMLVRTATDPAFEVEVTVSDRLDWSKDLKRLFFASKVP
jgi:phenylacetate-CoA ligase